MTTDRPIDTDDDELIDRVGRLEAEVSEVRRTMADLAQIVVGDIQERREAAIAYSAPVPSVPIPDSVMPGAQSTIDAVAAVRKPWMLVDLLREVGGAARMYLDPRYRVRRSSQIVVPILLVSFVVNYLMFRFALPAVPVLSDLVERLILIVLAVLLYRVVSKEVARYRQVMAQMAIGAKARAIYPVTLLNNDAEGAPVTRVESP